MKNYKTIEINDYESLNTVAERLGISLSEFIGFHNVHASKEEIILSKEQTNINLFYVYDWIFDKIIDPTLKVPLGENYKLEHYPVTKTLRYGVMYILENDEVIKFEIDLLFKKQNNYFVCHINRTTPVFINDVEADTIADELAQLIGDTLYPLDLLIDQSGNFIQVLNFEAIQKRWMQTKENVYKDYEGHWVDSKLKDSETTIAIENDFTYYLQNDLFLKSYFSGIYDCYFKEYSFVKNIAFPIIDTTTPISYQIQYAIKELWDNNNLIKVTANGVCNDKRSFEELEGGIVANNQTTTPAKGTYKAHYFLTPDTHTIKSFEVAYDLELSTTIKITIIVNQIE